MKKIGGHSYYWDFKARIAAKAMQYFVLGRNIDMQAWGLVAAGDHWEEGGKDEASVYKQQVGSAWSGAM